MPAEVIVEVKNVGKTYDSGVEALKDINLALPRGELSTFLGPSGCGKTTLLKIIAGLISSAPLLRSIMGRVIFKTVPGRCDSKTI